MGDLFNSIFHGIIAAIILPISIFWPHPATPAQIHIQQVVKTTVSPISSPTPTQEPMPTTKPIHKAILYTYPTDIPTVLIQDPTPTQAVDNSQFKQQISNVISSYNNQIQQAKLQAQQLCVDQTNQIDQKYNPKIQAVQQQISTLNQQENSTCPDGLLSEACQVGSNYTQIQYIQGQINSLTSEISSLQQEENQEKNALPCQYSYSQTQPTPIQIYIKQNLPTVLNIQSDPGTNGYLIWGENGTYVHVQPNGLGGYTVW